jgi:uncharacterized cupin superfamily protein
VVLVTDDGEEPLKPGDSVAVQMNDPNAHHFRNRSDKAAAFFDIGLRASLAAFPDRSQR